MEKISYITSDTKSSKSPTEQLSYLTSPERIPFGSNSFFKLLRSVVLPRPDGPQINTKSPDSTSKLISLRILSSDSLYLKLKLLNSINALGLPPKKKKKSMEITIQ